MSDCPIEFHTYPQLLDKIPPPIPASRALPDWYKQMPMRFEDEDTVKRCQPFLDAMSNGYLIPLHLDVTVRMTESQMHVDVALLDPPAIQAHLPKQFVGSPFPKIPALKFNIPWIIRTPPGYSTLFISPINRYPTPILPLSGFVDTDRFYLAMSFPSVCLLKPGEEVKLARGTPLVQVIPIKRENWHAALGPLDAELQGSDNALLQGNMHMYKDDKWVKKTFT